MKAIPILLALTTAAFSQGPLAPSSAPAPLMKTLDQIQPRTPITTLPLNITQSGSYYLTKSFAQVFTDDAITIQANNVTVDFCGFTIQQTGATASIVGIRINAPSVIALRNAVIRNGTIAGFAAVGITPLGPQNCLIEDLAIMQCAGGIIFQAYGSVGAARNTFRRCRTHENTTSGILVLSGAGNVGNVIENCESLNNGSAGFSLAAAGNFILGCRASGNATNYVIAIGNRGGVIVLPTPSTRGF